jgi:Zn-dependent protease
VDNNLLFTIGISAPMILLALSVHECAHAWTARLFGDPTAEQQGRISLNPLVHLDLMGTLAFLFCGFGWAKPVPYDRGNLLAAHPRHVRWTELAVAAAGPLSNLLLAGGLRLVLAGADALGAHGGARDILCEMMKYGVWINAGLFLFNLIPLHPLDGFTILRNTLPLEAAQRFQRSAPYGGILLLGLILIGQATHTSLLGSAPDFLLHYVYWL